MFGFLRRFRKQQSESSGTPAEALGAELKAGDERAETEARDSVTDNGAEAETRLHAPVKEDKHAEEPATRTEKAAKAAPQPARTSPATELDPEPKPGLWAGLRARLERTRKGLTEGLASLVLGKKQIDDELLEDIETRLLLADVGMDTTRTLINELTRKVERKDLDRKSVV